ncbi:MAG: hypothetical protein RLZZ78_1980, partial [Armatimonadota bacterium]
VITVQWLNIQVNIFGETIDQIPTFGEAGTALKDDN